MKIVITVISSMFHPFLTFSVSMYTYAVMGVNTALIQAAIMSIAKIHTIVPAKVEARVDFIKGNFKIQALPVQGLNKITAATYVIFLSADNLHNNFNSYKKNA
jgi:hypothetical protein